MPNWEYELVEVYDLANFVAEAGLGVLLHEEVNCAMFDHNSVNAVLVDCFVDEFQLYDVLLISFSEERGWDIDKHAHDGGGELVVVFETLVCCFFEGVDWIDFL